MNRTNAGNGSSRASSGPKIPVMVCVDVEPNEWYPRTGTPADWSGYERSFEYFQQIRPDLRETTGSPVHINWFYRMDPQIEQGYGSLDWGATHYRDIIEAADREGDGAGLHTHAYRWDARRSAWMVDHGDQDWVDHCVSSSVRAFEASFKKKCEMFRFGSRWMNNATVKLLDQLGVRFEMTVEPGYVEVRSDRYTDLVTGVVLNHKGAPRAPYYPLPSDFRKADGQKRNGIRVIPVSSGAGSHPYSMARKLYWLLLQPQKLKKFYLRLDSALDPYYFKRLLDELLTAEKNRYLTLIQRTDVFVKPGLFKNVRENYRTMLGHPMADRFVFATPTEAMSLLGD